MPASLLIAVVIASATIAADKPVVKSERFTYRVTGLFAPDREKDLRKAFDEIPDIKLITVDFKEAEVTLEFEVSKLFPRQQPERVTELLNEKVRAATRYTFSIKPRRVTARQDLVTVEIPVAGCDCKACCLAAYEAVAFIEGVEQATASFKDGKVTALINPTKTNKKSLEDALRKRGVDLLDKPAKK